MRQAMIVTNIDWWGKYKNWDQSSAPQYNPLFSEKSKKIIGMLLQRTFHISSVKNIGVLQLAPSIDHQISAMFTILERCICIFEVNLTHGKKNKNSLLICSVFADTTGTDLELSQVILLDIKTFFKKLEKSVQIRNTGDKYHIISKILMHPLHIIQRFNSMWQG